jgi:hypothetical protein
MVQTTLIVDPSGNLAEGRASLQTNPPFYTSGAGSVPIKCADILSRKKTTSTSDFLSAYGLPTLKTSLTTFNTSVAMTAPLNQQKDITSSSGYDEVNTFLTTVENTSLPVLRLVHSCLEEDGQLDKTEYNSAKASKEESKLRLDSILTPERHLSYYDGWFPIIRPMHETSLFVLFGLALFMLIASILFFLRMGGVHIQINIPQLSVPYPDASSFSASSKPYIFGGLAAGFLATYIAYKLGYV